MGAIGPITGAPPNEIDYVSSTASDTAITATSGDTANVVLTGAAHTYDGITKIRVEFFCYNAVAATGPFAPLLHDITAPGAKLGALAIVIGSTSAPIMAAKEFTPAAGTHQYVVAAATFGGGTGHLTAGDGLAENGVPMYLRITRV